MSMWLHKSSAWTAINEDNTDIGTLNACVRVTKKHDGNYVSFVDTSIKVNINAEGKFQTFENAITVVGTSMKSLEQNQTKEIVMDSYYLCGPSDSGNPERSYKIGQSFSICVGPTEAEKNNYDYVAVVGFEDVTCAKTIKVVENRDETALTTVTTNPEGYKKAGEGTVGTGFLSFETVVTPEYYTGVIAPNEASVTCSGAVELSFTDPTPPAPKFTQVGCTKKFYFSTTTVKNLGDFGEESLEKCNDHCEDHHRNFFILQCPQKNTSGDSPTFEYRCDCLDNTSDIRFGLDCDMQDTSINYVCDLSLAGGSDYKFGVGDTVRDENFHYVHLEAPVYKVVVPEERRLTASFSTNSGDLLQRHLQESSNQEDTSGSFGTEVLLSGEDNAVFGNLAAPAADKRCRRPCCCRCCCPGLRRTRTICKNWTRTSLKTHQYLSPKKIFHVQGPKDTSAAAGPPVEA